MSPEQDAYDKLRCYTLLHRAPSFIHQHVVDAFTAQHANDQTKPIGLTFALVGLYLLVERRFSGKQIQRVHARLASNKRPWPVFMLPLDRGLMTVVDVTATPEGVERDAAIYAWCSSVWGAFHENRRAVVELLGQFGIADLSQAAPVLPDGRG